jgi:hypothetical protein
MAFIQHPNGTGASIRGVFAGFSTGGAVVPVTDIYFGPVVKIYQ